MSEPAAAVPPPGQRRIILFAVVLGTFLQVLDSSIATITLPHMQGSLSATQDQISWVMTSYMVAIVVMTPLTGYLGARFGRRRALLVSIVGFIVAALCASQSTSLTEIIVFRIIQGFFAASLMPVTQTVILDTFPRRELALAMGWRSLGTMLSMSIGPVIGGLVIEYHNWRWGFYLNVPVALLAFTMVYLFVPESRSRKTEHLNWFGFLTLAVGLGALQLMFNRGQRLDWFSSQEIVLTGCLAAIGLYLFVANSLVTRRPFIEPGIFKDRNFVIGVMLVFVFVWLMFSIFVLMPAFLQDIRGFPIAEVGQVMGARAVATMLASVVAGWLVERTGARRVMLLGLVFLATGMWQMSLFTTDVGFPFIVLSSVMFGLGSGFGFIPLNVSAFWTLDARHRGMGSGLFALMSILGGTTGIAVMVTGLVRNAEIHRAALVEAISPYNEVLRHVPLPEGWVLDDPAGLAAIAEEVQRQALMSAYVDDFRILTLLAVLCMPLIYFMRKPRADAAPTPQPATAASR